MRTPEQIRRSIAAQAGVLVASKGCPPNAAAQMTKQDEALKPAGGTPVERIVMAPVPERAVFAWECNVRGKDWQRIINHLTAGKARYEYLLDLRDAWPDATFADITVRKVGPAHTSEAHKRTASYRGRPELTCGRRVEVRSGGQRALGVIVGHNDSANFDVLFDDDTYFAGGIGNVHPSEILAL